MPNLKCKACGEAITDEKGCTKCGYLMSPRKKSHFLRNFFIGLGVFFIIALINHELKLLTKTKQKDGYIVADFNKECEGLFHNYSKTIPWGLIPDLDDKVEALQKKLFNDYISSIKAQGYSIKNPNYNNTVLMAMFLGNVLEGVGERRRFLENNTKHSKEDCYIDGQERIKNMDNRVFAQLAPIAAFNEMQQGCKKDGCFFAGQNK